MNVMDGTVSYNFLQDYTLLVLFLQYFSIFELESI